MNLKATAIGATALLLCASGAARAETQGILACQIDLSQFASDVHASKDRLQPAQVKAARQLVEVSRSQCRSGPGLVHVNIRSMRQELALSTGQHPGTQFSEFWPPDPQELALLRE